MAIHFVVVLFYIDKDRLNAPAKRLTRKETRFGCMLGFSIGIIAK